MPELTTEEKPKSSEQIDLDNAEDALREKDYKTARQLLEKLGKSLHINRKINFGF
jgi:hypothetical protein